MSQNPIRRPVFDNWPPIHAALEKAYVELGLVKIQTSISSTQFPDDHWAIAGLMYNAGRNAFLLSGQGKCWTCRVDLDYDTVIRCLDCKLPLCERCAPIHFGPGHGQRAQQAHG